MVKYLIEIISIIVIVLGNFYLKINKLKILIKKFQMDRPVNSAPLQSTGGAVPVKNEKGEISMQKVKVQRYVAGKR